MTYLKEKIKLTKETMGQLAYYHTCKKSLTGPFINKI